MIYQCMVMVSLKVETMHLLWIFVYFYLYSDIFLIYEYGPSSFMSNSVHVSSCTWQRLVRKKKVVGLNVFDFSIDYWTHLVLWVICIM